MKRPMLVLGVTIAATNAVLLNFGISALVAVAFASAVFILYLIKPLKLKEFVIIPAVALGILLSCVSCEVFTKLRVEKIKNFECQDADIYGTAVTVTPDSSESNLVKFYCDTFNGKKCGQYILVSVPIEISPEVCDYCHLENCDVTFKKDGDGALKRTAIAKNEMLTANYDNMSVLWKNTKGVVLKCASIRNAITEKICSYLDGDSAGLCFGMLFGDTSRLSDSSINDFRNSGLSHLLAVSGLHTSLWCGLLLHLLTLFKISKRSKVVVCGIFLVLFCVISSFAPSVLRASLMTFLALIAPIFDKEADSFNSLGLSVAALTLINPYTVFSASFLLSVSATAGVIASQPVTEMLLKKPKKLKVKLLRRVTCYLISTFCVSVFASLFTLPVSAHLFGAVRTVAPIANLLAVKPAFYALVFSALGVAISFIPLYAVNSVTIFLFSICKTLISLTFKIANAFGSLKYSYIPVFSEIIFFSLLLCVFVFAILLPLTPVNLGNTLTVVDNGEYVFAILRSGTDYAAFVASKLPKKPQYFDCLPVTNCEKLSFAYFNSVTNIASYDAFIKSNSPETVVLTPYAYKKFTDTATSRTR